MSPVVASTVAAAQNNERRGRGMFTQSFLNPFKRRRQTLYQDIEEETSRSSHGESPEPRVVEGPQVSRLGVQLSQGPSGRHDDSGDGIQREPSSSINDPHDQSEPVTRIPGEENYMHETTPLRDAEYLDSDVEDEQYFLTPTPYPTLVRQFALVPTSSILTVLTLFLILHTIWSSETWSPSQKSYLGCFVFAAAAWIVSFAFRIPLYLFSSFLCRPFPSFAFFFSTLVQVLCEETVRLFALVLVHLRVRDTLHPSDHAFPRVWVLAMGWATVEVSVSIWQGYEQLAAYKDVMPPAYDPAVPPVSLLESVIHDDAVESRSDNPGRHHVFEDPEGYMYREIEQLIQVRARLELEELYGIPVPNIPVFISCLQRIDSIILSLAIFLHMSASYVKNVAQQNVPYDPPPHLNYARAIRETLPAFAVIVTLHTFLLFIWSASILPRVGVHSASYVGLVVSLGALFAGLGRWNAL